MFEHKDLDGQKHRVLDADKEFLSGAILETREPKNGQAIESAGRAQHAVVEGSLVERFLPPETIGEKWSHEPSTAWWEVVGHPPHAGIVADFNSFQGGAYHRTLNPADNLVAFAEQGERVVMSGSAYSVVRSSDGTTLEQPSLLALRAAYYA
ncbi:hypothetical protein [Halioxenophilus sp. WMMB6]|uniref:hypothetical protein n=1 Tax=Halioxenophilus sp. WMMB6 TaxID=3073815 RepID=UPI00295E5020|nr:hypothetical protein [Halioxenophilus sp. WMMB6]